MAELNFGPQTSEANDNKDEKVQPSPSMTENNMSEELNEANKIIVTLANPNVPIVVFFGPAACGKTMTLVRMTRFLKKQGYSVAPVRSFRPSYDTNYKEMCDNFDTMINQNDSARSTSLISFMLVDVIKNGRPICQILEAPGEYYFSLKNVNRGFPSYVNTITSSQNRKIYVVMVEPDWADESDRRNYVSRISELKQRMRAGKDKTIFFFNKIDKTKFVISSGNTNMNEARKYVKNLYPGIFDMFKNQNPITSLWNEYLCDFAAFQTGYFTEVVSGDPTFQEGPDEYPKKFWNIVLNQIKG